MRCSRVARSGSVPGAASEAEAMGPAGVGVGVGDGVAEAGGVGAGVSSPAMVKTVPRKTTTMKAAVSNAPTTPQMITGRHGMLREVKSALLLR